MVEHHGLIGEGGEGNLPTFLYNVQMERKTNENINGKFYGKRQWKTFFGCGREHREGEYRMNYVKDMEKEERKAEEWI